MHLLRVCACLPAGPHGVRADVWSWEVLTSGLSLLAIRACGDKLWSVSPTAMEHHVYFWLKEEHQNEEDRACFEQGLSGLFKIPLVAGGRWAVPAKVMIRPVIDQSWDYALTMQFGNIEEHDAYQVDADHNVFIAAFKDWWKKVLVMDLE
jgi:Stress responsive A/B Barrel Domain